MLNLKSPSSSKNNPISDCGSQKTGVKSEAHGGLFAFGIHQQSQSYRICHVS